MIAPPPPILQGFVLPADGALPVGPSPTPALAPCGRPQALAETFADVLNAISKDAATAVIKSVYQNVPHDIDLQAD